MRRAFGNSGLVSTSCVALALCGVFGVSAALANDKLIKLSESDENCVMPGKDYTSDNYSKMDQINTGERQGAEGCLVILDRPVARSRGHAARHQRRHVHQHVLPEQRVRARPEQSRQDPVAAQAEAGSGRPLGRVLRSRQSRSGLLAGRRQDPVPDLQQSARRSRRGAQRRDRREYWKVENSDIKVGSTLTQAPYVVKDLVLVGSSGAELGVRGYTTAYNVDRRAGVAQIRDRSRRGDRHRRRLQQGQPALRQKGLGTATWEGDAWKIGGGTNWGWYAYDPEH